MINPIDIIATLEPWWMVPIALALLSLGIAIPIRAIMYQGNFIILRKRTWFVVIGPIVEEIFFRLFLLMFLIGTFGLIPGLLGSAILYMIYMGLVYGPPFTADGLVMGVLFSLAFFELGLPIVIMAHIIYSAVSSVW